MAASIKQVLRVVRPRLFQHLVRKQQAASQRSYAVKYVPDIPPPELGKNRSENVKFRFIGRGQHGNSS